MRRRQTGVWPVSSRGGVAASAEIKHVQKKTVPGLGDFFGQVFHPAGAPEPRTPSSKLGLNTRPATRVKALVGAEGGAADVRDVRVIQTYQAAHGGVVFYRTPSARHRVRRMRFAALAVTLAVGFSGGVLHQFHAQTALNADLGGAESPIPTGPFAYFPR